MTPGTRRARRRLWLLARALIAPLALAAAGCSTLPDYARPSATRMEPGTYRPADVISYRALTRHDFLAAAPPREIAEHAAEFGAYTCAVISPGSEQTQMVASFDPGAREYVASVVNMEVRAEMDRQCSWWNPNPPDLPSAYILEHEQIHFAIFELGARRLHRELEQLTARGDSPEDAADRLQRAIDRAIEAAMKNVLERSTDFDEDTSYQYRPDRQARWLVDVTAELKRSR